MERPVPLFCQFNELMSVFYVSVLLLIMKRVITLSKRCGSTRRSASFFTITKQKRRRLPVALRPCSRKFCPRNFCSRKLSFYVSVRPLIDHQNRPIRKRETDQLFEVECSWWEHLIRSDCRRASFVSNHQFWAVWSFSLIDCSQLNLGPVVRKQVKCLPRVKSLYPQVKF